MWRTQKWSYKDIFVYFTNLLLLLYPSTSFTRLKSGKHLINLFKAVDVWTLCFRFYLLQYFILYRRRTAVLLSWKVGMGDFSGPKSNNSSPIFQTTHHSKNGGGCSDKKNFRSSCLTKYAETWTYCISLDPPIPKPLAIKKGEGTSSPPPSILWIYQV